MITARRNIVRMPARRLQHATVRTANSIVTPKKGWLMIGAGLVFCVMLATAIWRYQVNQNLPRESHIALLLDCSDSRHCEATAAIIAARQLLNSPGLGNGSKLLASVTGDANRKDEPHALGEYPIPRRNGLLEGRDVLEAKQNELLESLRAKVATLASTKRSPIFLALKRAVESLRGLGCNGRNLCYLNAQSDLEETAEDSIRTALARPRKAMSRSDDWAGSLPAPINNEGIQVTICGLADANETGPKASPAHTAEQADWTKEVWTHLFTQPQLVKFEPHCPKD